MTSYGVRFTHFSMRWAAGSNPTPPLLCGYSRNEEARRVLAFLSNCKRHLYSLSRARACVRGRLQSGPHTTSLFL